MTCLLGFLLIVTQPVAAQAEAPLLSISLNEAERAALAHSPILKAAQSNLSAAEDQVEVQLSQILPRLTADGSYQYQTEVPKFSFIPGAPAVQFGDHHSYSIGPALTFTVWDQGALFKAWRSQKALVRSQESQRELILRQVTLMTRLDYFQVQLALEQERSLVDSLRLAEAQYRDINSRFHAGSSSRIDWLSAHQQVLDRRRDLRSAQADLATSLRTLFAQTGQGQDTDLSVAIDDRIEGSLPAEIKTPSVHIALEPLASLEGKFETAASAALDSSYPQLAVYREQAESQRLSAASTSAGQWPKVQFTGKSDYLYPNLPLLESTWQNTALLTASMPLFEFGRTQRQAKAQNALADASERQRDEAYDELVRDWHKAHDQFAALRDQEVIDRESVAETAEIARLRYASYRDGGSTILDVETANLNVVQSRVTAARTQTQILIQLATLDSLSAQKGKP